ncbi:MAG: branched-chain amino acid ABC transporter permease [Actinobacteria bacterium]|nr:branched-chain amino acid ABC transporter permease [Actinomycetota bacterium]
MKQLVEVLISGVIMGAVYSVNALGLSLVYGVSRVFNFAYGSFFTWGAYFGWLLAGGALGLPYPLVFLISGLVLFVAGVAFERFLIRPLRWRSQWQITTMLTTLGLAVLLDNVALQVFGPLVHRLPPLFAGAVTLIGFRVGIHGLAMLAIAVLSVVALELYLARARTGRAMRAVAQDMTGAQIVGIPLNRIFGYAFGASAVMAGFSGILLAPIYLISPLVGWDPFIKAFVIVVLGGLESLKGTVIAAFLLGVGEALVTWRFGGVWTLSFWFLALLVVLIIRPRGLFGRWA